MNTLSANKFCISILIILFSFSSCKEKQEIVAPTIETLAPSEVLTASAKVGGKILSNGGGTITASGICWSSGHAPGIEDSKTVDGSVSGNFESSLSGLSADQKYYYRAYATNENGTSYGAEFILVTSNGTVSDYEGNVYTTVKIGTQVWMRENLRSTKYSDGSLIPGIHATANPESTGRLYNSDAARKGAAASVNIPSGVQGACPTGWHLPSDGEWKNLESALGMLGVQTDLKNYRGTDEGNYLKEAGTKHWGAGNMASNSSGLTILPASTWDYNNNQFITSINPDGSFAQYWTTTNEYNIRAVSQNYSQIWRGYVDIQFGLLVRCIKD
jgi:uncharacterized protein (TIGR02145 family)